MKRHETPHEIAFALARHAPKTIRALLDPAVGTGNLIEPLLSRLRRNATKVHCIDSDPEAIQHVEKTLRNELPPHAHLIQADFLEWSRRCESSQFDCVVMNPPFAGKKANWYPIKTVNAVGKSILRHAPLEAAFLRKGIELLVNGGRLLAVLPSSIVMSESLQWLRVEMMRTGAIRFVHELPPRTFSSVEARMYLMVFDKGARQKQIALLNHDLHKPERLTLPCNDKQLTRLDFGFVYGGRRLAQLQERDSLGWAPIGSVAQLMRGDIDSPNGPKCAVHSTDYSNGFWHASGRHQRSVGNCPSRKVQRGDLLISRVGRNAFRSVGRGVGLLGMSCSDCVLIIRPTTQQASLKLLFALRFVLSHEWSRSLVERGTGASYISQGNLIELPIPFALCKQYPEQFRNFVAAERAGSSDRSRASIDSVAKMVSRERM